jgi:hypothetical protein
MARAQSTFRERDVRAAIKAAEAVGHTVASVKINRDGQIEIVLGKSSYEADPAPDWDRYLKEHQP